MTIHSKDTIKLLRDPAVKAALQRLLSREVDEIAVAGVVIRRLDY
jgi:hypothetical protein